MSDDEWRRDERRRRDGRDVDDSEEFGGPLFPDEPPVEGDEGHRNGPVDDTAQRRLRFGPDDTGPLPHWTAPPTGEIPSLGTPPPGAGAADDDADDVDVWSTFTTESPVWRDDDPVTTVMDQVQREADTSGGVGRPSDAAQRGDPSSPYDRPGDITGSGEYDLPSSDYGRYGTGYGSSTGEVPRQSGGRPGDRSGEVPLSRREPGRITIGTDPSLMPRRPTDPMRRRPGQARSGRPAGPTRTAAAPPRNMGNAVVAGLVIAAIFIIALLTRPVIVLAIIVVILALAAWEYFGKITEKGYRPAVAPGLAACVCAPLAAYWLGDSTLPLVVAFAFMAGAIGFIGAHGVESGPLPNMAVTTMGVVWIGLLGAYAALILRMSTAPEFGLGTDIGTDTLFMVALGVAANDIGALVVGSAVGRTPLRPWVSPSKTLEGLLGGALVTIIALFIASKINTEGTWTDAGDVLLLGLVIAVMAPLGDLTESMFKRNLDIKDFGTIVQGHGGVLDRFDGYLFALPAVYYYTLVTLF
jgi:phosphatidate cytidylyltransferase